MELKCVPQMYDWGKKGENSLVGQMLTKTYKDLKISEGVPYAELWMGTHPNGESCIRETGQTLLDFLKSNPSKMGTALQLRNGDLPFLFKILSIEKALSIQVHPNKATAEKLHAEFPNVYKDDNHKPEIAVAVTEFECLVGFRPVDEIIHFFELVPELSNLFSKDLLDKFYAQHDMPLSLIFSGLMQSHPDNIKKNLKTLLTRLETSVHQVQEECLYPLLSKVTSEFPNDVGCFTIYFLNYVKLRPGEAIYLHPGLPHSYLSGDIVECMACSDNVVRAGLTPKFRDVDTLCHILDYTSYPRRELICLSKMIDGCTTVYSTPINDFGVSKIEIFWGESYTIPRQAACSIIVIMSGEGTSEQITVEAGRVFFLEADMEVKITNGKSKVPILIFQAYSKNR